MGKVARMYWLLLYEVTDDYLERRVDSGPSTCRSQAAVPNSGELLLAGTFAEPADGAALAFRTRADDAARSRRSSGRSVRARTGWSTSWRIRPWPS